MSISPVQPLELGKSQASATWLAEPNLLFAGGQKCTNPKVGIPLYGPRSLNTGRHKKEIHVGLIGTGEAVEHTVSFFTKCCEGVDGDAEHFPFPGCKADRGFQSELEFDDRMVEKITQHERQEIVDIKFSRERLERLLGLLQAKMEVLTRRDHPLDYIVLALPEDLYLKCRSATYRVKHVEVYRNLRRAFKAMAMQFLKPTQILLESTTGLTQSTREVDHKSVVAWNLFCGLYFKVDGLPWGPVGLPPGTCHIGIGFFRPLGETSTLRASVVQAFDENGEGLVLRGRDFDWDEVKQGKSPHLSEDMAADLVQKVLAAYQKERQGQIPQRVVVHKVSRYEEAERRGFQAGLAKVKEYDLLTVHPVSETRLIRAGTRPVLRGTSFSVGDQHYLYTTGYLPDLGQYPHGHVPSPLLLADHIGDTPVEKLQQEILTLTKMNWNSANMHGLMPITLRFARLVGDIMREFPAGMGREPEPKYKYYM